MSRRPKKTRTESDAESARLRKENAELRADNAKLRASVDGLAGQVEELGRQIAKLTKALTDAQRAGKRQAAPFRRKTRKADPKRPGRKPGHKGEWRAIPDKVDRVLHGPALTHCPDCGHGVDDVHTSTNYETDLPKVEPQVTQYVFDSAWCSHCDRQVHAPHPEQTATATGAAASHLGPRVRSLSADLKHRLGVPYRKQSDLLQAHFGLRVSAGGIVQANYRLTERARPTYDEIRKELARSELIHADETGWRVDSDSWWLWVVCSKALTAYRITDHRSAKAVVELLGPSIKGRLFRDGWASYDKQLAGWPMLRCLLHLQRNAEDLLREQTGGAKDTPSLFLDWLDDVFLLKRQAATLTPEAYADRAAGLEASWDWMLEHLRMSEDDERNLGFMARLGGAQEQILPLLRERALPVANNQAERQIRPAVVIRKISAGNKTGRGARTHEVLASLAASCRQQGAAFADVVRQILVGPAGKVARFWRPKPSPAPS
ncbi:MAG TPA: IS66 family transposase [Myxococcota bacterium]|nr:IS66 family transposase [Myxococcota bacterium]